MQASGRRMERPHRESRLPAMQAPLPTMFKGRHAPVVRLAVASLALVSFIGLAFYGFFSEKLYFLLWALVLAAIAPSLFIPRFGNYLLIFASVTVPLSLFETGAELLKPAAPQLLRSPHFDSISDYPSRYFDASDLGSQPRPGIFRGRKIGSDGSMIYDVKYTIGNDRFRVTPQKEKSFKSRINFLGCSLMIGEGLGDNETLPYFFSQKLPDYRVKNFGSHGFGVHQALAILESDRNTSGELNFLLTAPWHGERMVCIARESASRNPVYIFTEGGDAIRDGDCTEIENNPPPAPSRLARIFGKSNLGLLMKKSFMDGALQDRQMDLYLAMIKKISILSKERKQKFIVGFVKADENYFIGSWSNEKILKQLNTWGIDTIDMTLADRSENIPNIYYIHGEERHPSAIANERRASLLADYVLQERLLH